MQNVGAALDLWEGSTQILGINCMKNIFFFNNTCVGYIGPKNSQQPIVNTHFPYYNPLINTYSRVENIKIWNNIFSADKNTYPLLRGFLSNFGLGHPTPNSIDLSENLWNYSYSNKTASDTVNTQLPGSLALFANGNFNALVPAKINAAFVKTAQSFVHTPTTDFYGKTRLGKTNVGAFEFDPSLGLTEFNVQHRFWVYPNPTAQSFHVPGYNGRLHLFDLSGRLISILSTQNSGYNLPDELPCGSYILNKEGKPHQATLLQVVHE
jgi:hypothetical protein